MFHRVATLADLGPGDIVPIQVEGVSMILYRDGDRVYAAQRRCIHQGGDLAAGSISGGHLECSVHGWRFDVATGVHELSPETCIAVFDVQVVDGAIEVDPTPRRYGKVPT